VAAETRPAQIASQCKVVRATVLELGRQTNHIWSRGQNLLDHAGALFGTLERDHRRRVSRRFRPSGDHAHSKVLLEISTNEHKTHG
jgi:hypothetical protein